MNREDSIRKYRSFSKIEREYQATIFGDLTFCFIDFETTGFDPREDEIIEIGAVKLEGKEEVGRLSSLVNPGIKIPQGVTRLTGIDDGMVSACPKMGEFFPELENFIASSIVVAYTRFEEEFLKVLYERYGNRKFKNPFIDAMDIAIMLMPSLKGHRLEDLTTLWGLNARDSHRALSDAITLSQVFDYLLNGIYQMHPSIIGTLLDHAPEGSGITQLLSKILYEITGGRKVPRLVLDEIVPVDREWENVQPLCGDGSGVAITKEEICDFFSQDGPLSEQFQEYEEREEQVLMAEAVRGAYSEGKILVVEAGTGTGKSLAYLFPSVARSKERGLPIIVSTKTLNLQDQLFTKDLPILSFSLGENSFRYSVLKGYPNYVCLRKLQALISSKRILEEGQIGILGMLITWIAEGCEGDVSLLNVSNLRGLEYEVLSDHRECAAERCFFARNRECFYRRALFRAKRSNIVVVNHSLLLTGLSIPCESLVIDEAHALEDVATDQFSVEVSYFGTRKFLEFLAKSKVGTGFLFDYAESLSDVLTVKDLERVKNVISDAKRATYDAIDSLELLFLALSEFYEGIEEYETEDIRFSQARQDSIEYEALLTEAESFSKSLDALVEKLEKAYGIIKACAIEDSDETESLLVELAGKIARLKDIRLALEMVFDESCEERVRWATVAPSSRLSLQALRSSPIDVGFNLYSTLYSSFDSIVMTSATLTVNGSFEFFCSRLGLELLEPERLEVLALPSSFDFTEQMQLLVLEEIPDPRTFEYAGLLPDLIIEAIVASGGGALVLFTNRKLMLDVYDKVSKRLAEAGLEVYCQEHSLSRRRITEQFVLSESASLFGTASFWEGVDAKGRTLRLVIVTRIPFESPGKPVFEARCESLKKKGISDFASLSLPLAALRLKQGVGRLIRTRNDIGQVLITDPRIVTEAYGRVLLASLPQGKVLRVKREELKEVIDSFMSG